MNSILNLWEDYSFNVLEERQNKSWQWNGPDTLENLKKTRKNSAMTTYELSEFDYKFNAHGFRSDEFDNSCDVKILYGGCSLTEGIGLPREHTWAAFTNEHISNELKKPIKLFNVGVGGFSIDAIVRMVYVTVETGKLIPDVVFLLLPSPARNEYLLIDRNNNRNLHHFIANFREYSDPEIRVFHENALKSYLMTQRVHETFRNLLFLQTYLEFKNIQLYFSTWDNHPIMIHPIHGPNLGFVEILEKHAPERIRKCFVPARIEYDSFAEQEKSINFEKRFKQNIGRDGMHQGPNSHWNFSKDFYSRIKSRPDFAETLNKWKNAY